MNDRLYELLPAFYRVRDSEQGEPLRALAAIIQAELDALEGDIEGLYENWFIETCEEWVVPYIADLLGIRGLPPARGASVTQRAFVANTIDYRRRKGTAEVLEQIARDVSGYDARVQEYFDRLVTSTYLNHVRLTHPATVDLRNQPVLEALNTAFDGTAHNVDVRSVALGRGKHNIPNIGLFLWRVRAFQLTQAPAVSQSATQFRLSPLGIDAPLYTRPRTQAKITQFATPLDVPIPISRRRMDAALGSYYGENLSVQLFADGQPVDLKKVIVCDLSDDKNGNWNRTRVGMYVIDPVLGRVLVPPDAIPKTLEASFFYGAVRAMGGGEYPRRKTFGPGVPAVVSSGGSIQTAITATGNSGVVEIADSDRFTETLAINMGAGRRLEIRAASGRCPTLVVSGPIVIDATNADELVLNGLWITGGPIRIQGTVRRVRILHCTLVPGTRLDTHRNPLSPGAPSLIVTDAAKTVEVVIEDSILGPIYAGIDAQVKISGSIVDATANNLIAFGNPATPADFGGAFDIVTSTVVGQINSRRTELVSNSLLVASAPAGQAPVRFQRRQEGCVRFSYVPLGSETPRKFHCRPESSSDSSSPDFSTLRFGFAAYGQLERSTRDEIHQGADDGSEMGAMHDLFEPQRVADLRYRLEEYLRVGLEAGLFFES